MTQKDKELLLKDLCARLPYGVVCADRYVDEKFTNTNKWNVLAIDGGTEQVCISNCEKIYGYKTSITNIKPYLFPVSSITEEQKSYINGRWGVNEHFEFEIDPLWGEYFVDLCDAVDFINWCYENHFDINGLIPRGLAEDATDKNIY